MRSQASSPGCARLFQRSGACDFNPFSSQPTFSAPAPGFAGTRRFSHTGHPASGMGSPSHRPTVAAAVGRVIADCAKYSTQYGCSLLRLHGLPARILRRGRGFPHARMGDARSARCGDTAPLRPSRQRIAGSQRQTKHRNNDISHQFPQNVQDKFKLPRHRRGSPQADIKIHLYT